MNDLFAAFADSHAYFDALDRTHDQALPPEALMMQLLPFLRLSDRAVLRATDTTLILRMLGTFSGMRCTIRKCGPGIDWRCSVKQKLRVWSAVQAAECRLHVTLAVTPLQWGLTHWSENAQRAASPPNSHRSIDAFIPGMFPGHRWGTGPRTLEGMTPMVRFAWQSRGVAQWMDGAKNMPLLITIEPFLGTSLEDAMTRPGPSSTFRVRLARLLVTDAVTRLQLLKQCIPGFQHPNFLPRSVIAAVACGMSRLTLSGTTRMAEPSEASDLMGVLDDIEIAWFPPDGDDGSANKENIQPELHNFGAALQALRRASPCLGTQTTLRCLAQWMAHAGRADTSMAQALWAMGAVSNTPPAPFGTPSAAMTAFNVGVHL